METVITAFNELFEDRIFQIQLFVCHLFALYTFVLSITTDNYSQVDRLWSIIPSIYAWSFVYFEYSTNGTQTDTFYRLFILSILITSWSIRLTFNYWRKGGYTVGSEDYRWEHVKKFLRYPEYKLPYQIFNLTFIALFQNWLLYAITLPLWYIQKYNRREPFNFYDLVLTVFYITALTYETIADEQQWNFQTKKHKWIKNKNVKDTQFNEADFKRGFLTKGLFAYSRHPNFFAEMFQWSIIFAFTLSSQYSVILKGDYSRVINPALVGVVVYILLFQGSTILTEKLSIAKYPNYKIYQKTVSRFVPSILSAYKDQAKE
jgi:steroid 5-alpha reductase family enzyme